MLELMRRPWVLLVSCALAGLLLGMLMSSLPTPSTRTTFWIGNLSSPWAVLAFIAGRSQRSRIWAAGAGVAAEVACVAGFYLIDAKDMDEAIQAASKIPPARVGSVEVRPVRELRT